ncbi:MAG TPA: hypothetical protein VMX13_06320 [Sedimentisphaerales bacterium]|nr:hypothetical protein [Sedimentisphaerales bacterium]
METVKEYGFKAAILAVMLLMCCHVMFGDADNWSPPGPPAPTMKSLDAIYEAVASMSPGISEREGYCRYFICPSGGAVTTILSVPAGKRFVLRKLSVTQSAEVWSISGGPNLHIDAHICYAAYESTAGSDQYQFAWDFPDGCAVVEGPNDLTFTNNHASLAIHTHFVGYLYDVP